MKVIDKNGNVLIEKETQPITAKKPSLRAIRHTKGRRKTVVPVVMSKEEFFAKIDEAKNEIANGKGKTFDNVEELDRYIRSL